MNHSIPKLDKKGLREFGLVTGAIFALLFGILIPWIRSHGWPIWPWIVAAVLWGWALVAPMTLDPIYKVWMRFGLVLGAINTRILLGIVFYALMMPMGAIMRWAFKKDPMARKLDHHMESYRVPSTVRSRESMEKPF
ncbi:SxtJ family membrane protein [Phormidium sp. CCY1219]|uniref:SxtJ family membrane protein n=1 Tax=Phormidium sp. CCY1219 TaxID=2886104 RepID=UPI002D1E82A9|nr:SxtJ family membrane protein [Phormidium sp. CCY1219]MEB3827308.1 SxtJ family membrane protein [Phormidium sp. CCY1219]